MPEAELSLRCLNFHSILLSRITHLGEKSTGVWLARRVKKSKVRSASTGIAVSRRCDVIHNLINAIRDVGGYVGHYAGHDAPKVALAQTVPQSFSTENITHRLLKSVG